MCVSVIFQSVGFPRPRFGSRGKTWTLGLCYYVALLSVTSNGRLLQSSMTVSFSLNVQGRHGSFGWEAEQRDDEPDQRETFRVHASRESVHRRRLPDGPDALPEPTSGSSAARNGQDGHLPRPARLCRHRSDSHFGKLDITISLSTAGALFFPIGAPSFQSKITVRLHSWPWFIIIFFRVIEYYRWQKDETRNGLLLPFSYKSFSKKLIPRHRSIALSLFYHLLSMGTAKYDVSLGRIKYKIFVSMRSFFGEYAWDPWLYLIHLFCNRLHKKTRRRSPTWCGCWSAAAVPM